MTLSNTQQDYRRVAEIAARRDLNIPAMNRWASHVVDAWLGRRESSHEWHSPDYWWRLKATTSGRSISYGEVLVTRAHDGFVALVNGKRYRHRSWKLRMELLERALARRRVPVLVIRPPIPWGYVQAENLDRWYGALRGWQRLTADGRTARVRGIAEFLVSAYLDRESASYFDGYFSADATDDCIAVWSECIAVRARRGSRIMLLSARRYPRVSASRDIRDAVRLALQERAIPFRELRPAEAGYSTPRSLIAAWRASPMRVA